MKPKHQKLLQQIVNGALVLVVIGLLGFLSVRFDVKQDWTFNKRNTLSEASRKQLAAMHAPVHLVAFAYQGTDARANVQYFADLYQRFKKDVTVEFVDPTSQPQKVQEYDISQPNDVVVEYEGRRETLHSLSEQTITTALQRLSFKGDQWVVFVEGHGERGVTDAKSQNDFTAFAGALKDKGFTVQPLNLVKAQAVPDNTAVLVLADPKSALLPGELVIINDYIKKGGNLLWLSDTDETTGLDPVAATLGVHWQKGIGIFPVEYKLIDTGSPVIYVATGYPENPVTAGMDQQTWMPMVHSLTADTDKGWTTTPMLVADAPAWLETQPLSNDTPVSMDKAAGDIPGPLTLGMTFTRDVKVAAEPKPTPAAKPADAAAKPDDGADPAKAANDAAKPAEPKAADAADEASPSAAAATRQQRIAVVGDADFLANATLSQFGGNEQLGLNLFQWLASRDSQLNIDVPKSPDLNMMLPGWAQLLIGAGFVLVLPLALLGIGVTRWIVRRRR